MTLHQRERIDHALLILSESKTQRARRERLRQHKAIATIVMAALFVAVAVWMVATSGIEIGPQTEIYQTYKAVRHDPIAEEFPATGNKEVATK